MKLALILNAINPGVGGLLIRGEKGTAKSTAVRAFARILPEIEVMSDCPYSCDPQDISTLCHLCRNSPRASEKRKVRVVNLPLNATEEMVIGGLDFSESIRKGVPIFQPGLVARANRGILYIDEVNLLSDHLVNAILDVSTSGENIVQREGIAYAHQARFILVATMNPEEGELRPQLLDRFGLCVDVYGERDIGSRIQVMERRDSFDREARIFYQKFELEDRMLAAKISLARGLMQHIDLPLALQASIAEICNKSCVAGHRADIIIAHAAKAFAAFHGRNKVSMEDVLEVAALALPHRLKTDPNYFEKIREYNVVRDIERYPDAFDEYPEQRPLHASGGIPEMEKVGSGKRRYINRYNYPEAIFDIGQAFEIKQIVESNTDKHFRQTTGKRSHTLTKNKKGKYVRSTVRRLTGDIALDATLRASAPYQLKRKSEKGLAVTILNEDLREKIRESRTANFLLFLVDASGSMGAKGRMVASKGAIMSLLKDAYQKRDRVAMVSFRKREAVVNLPPTSSIYRAGKLLRELPVGGKTPLAAGLRKAQGLLRNVMLKDPTCKPILIIITDGKANESIGKGDPFWEALSAAKAIASRKKIKSIVVDTEEESGFRFGFSARLAEVLRADYFRIKDLKADRLLEIVRSDV